jgi:hypothetical protein
MGQSESSRTSSNGTGQVWILSALACRTMTLQFRQKVQCENSCNSGYHKVRCLSASAWVALWQRDCRKQGGPICTCWRSVRPHLRTELLSKHGRSDDWRFIPQKTPSPNQESPWVLIRRHDTHSPWRVIIRCNRYAVVHPKLSPGFLSPGFRGFRFPRFQVTLGDRHCLLETSQICAIPV